MRVKNFNKSKENCSGVFNRAIFFKITYERNLNAWNRIQQLNFIRIHNPGLGYAMLHIMLTLFIA
jgi:hypothetical protein